MKHCALNLAETPCGDDHDMSRRFLIALAPLLILAGTAHATSESKPVGDYVDILPLALPIVAQGRLVNYVFVTVRINVVKGANVAKLRDQEPFFRDALVRAAHRTPFTLQSDYQKIDEARLNAAMTREAAAIAGPGLVKSVVITSQVSQRRVGGSRPAPKPTL